MVRQLFYYLALQNFLTKWSVSVFQRPKRDHLLKRGNIQNTLYITTLSLPQANSSEFSLGRIFSLHVSLSAASNNFSLVFGGRSCFAFEAAEPTCSGRKLSLVNKFRHEISSSVVDSDKEGNDSCVSEDELQIDREYNQIRSEIDRMQLSHSDYYSFWQWCNLL